MPVGEWAPRAPHDGRHDHRGKGQTDDLARFGQFERAHVWVGVSQPREDEGGKYRCSGSDDCRHQNGAVDQGDQGKPTGRRHTEV